MADDENFLRKNKCAFFSVAVLVGIGLLLFIILFPMSFSYLDFYEVSKLTNNKNMVKIYK